MRRYFIRIGIFTLSFAFGISLVALLNFIYTTKQAVTLTLEQNATTKKGEGLVIEFKKFVDTDYGFLAVEFEITNYTDEVLIYTNYIDEKESYYSRLTPAIYIDGKLLKRYVCGTGLIKYELRPKESKVFRTSHLSTYWEKGKPMEFGYGFQQNASKNVAIYRTKPLPISREIEKKLLAEQKEMNLNR